jgi:hypothetical protein
MGEGENGGPARRVEKEEGGLAAGKTRDRRRRAASGGVRTGKTGEEEKPLTGGAWLLC